MIPRLEETRKLSMDGRTERRQALRIVAAEKGRHLRRPKFRECRATRRSPAYGDSVTGGVSPFTQAA
jgi:hypothetical protein